MLGWATARLAESRDRSGSYCHSLVLSSLSQEAGWPGPCAPRACWWRCCSAWAAWDRRSPRRLQTPPVTRSVLSSRDCSPDSNGFQKPLCQVSRGSLEHSPCTVESQGARGGSSQSALVWRGRGGRALCCRVPGNGRCAWGLDHLPREGSRVWMDSVHMPRAHVAVRKYASQSKEPQRSLF